MAVKFPSPKDVGAYVGLDYGHCCDYVAFLFKLPNQFLMNQDWKIGLRLDDEGVIHQPCFQMRFSDAWQRPEWEVERNVIPEAVQREAEKLRRHITRELAKVEVQAAAPEVMTA